MIPEGRTERYAIWRACERFGVRPPGVAGEWDECNLEAQASLIAFDQIRQNEEAQIAQVIASGFRI